MTTYLTFMFSYDKIKKALFSIKHEKYARANSIPLIFFQIFCHILEEDILEVVK